MLCVNTASEKEGALGEGMLSWSYASLWLNPDSKQYIRSLEQRLKGFERALQASPMGDESVILDSAEIDNSDGMLHVETTAAYRTSNLPSRWPREVMEEICQARQHISSFERAIVFPLPSRMYMAHLVSSVLDELPRQSCSLGHIECSRWYRDPVEDR